MAGARVVEVVRATDDAGVAPVLEPLVSGATVVGATEVGVTVLAAAAVVGTGGGGVRADGAEVAAAGAGDVVGVVTSVACVGTDDRPARAPTVPPRAPMTATMATPATTIRCLIDRMVRPVHQPGANAAATSPVSAPARLYTRRRTVHAGAWTSGPRGSTWISRRSKPSVS
jgi:hypothetical protein